MGEKQFFHKELFLLKGEKEGPYAIQFTMHVFALSQKKLMIIGDDCIKKLQINRREISLPKDNVCYGEKGFAVDLSSYYRQGSNRVNALVQDGGGTYGIYFRPTLQDPLFLVIWLLLLLSITGCAGLILQKLKVEKAVLLIIVGGIVLRLWYLYYTPFFIRTHDVHGHIEYISYIMSHNWKLPSADMCYECHQQPLYYLFSAFFLNLFSWTRLSSFILLQIVSFICNVCLLGIIFILFRKIWKDKLIRICSALIIFFFPSLIIHSIRITNESFYYVFHALTILFAYLYISQKKQRFIVVYCIVAGLTFYSKINAVSLFIIPLLYLCAIFLYGKWKQKQYVLFFTVVTFLLICFITFFLFFFQNISLIQKTAAQLTKSNQIQKELTVGNAIRNYVGFDLMKYLKHPYISPWDDVYGRQYVGNYLARSSLFGEFWFDTPLHKRIALAIGCLYLALLGIAGYGLVKSLIVEQAKIGLFFFIHGVVIMGVFLVYRYLFPAACNTDFRYILPIFISFLYFLLQGLHSFQKNKFLYVIGSVCIFCFAVLSIVFFLSFPFYTMII